MAIDFQKTFGASSNNVASTGKADRPKSQYWINIGYDSGVQDAEGNNRFVSLAVGIPLDGQEKLPTNSRNAEFAAFQAARNDLAEQIMAVAKTLQPGEERLLNLQVQLRRINEEHAEIAPENNQFARKLSL
jgi:hypothetical protein